MTHPRGPLLTAAVRAPGVERRIHPRLTFPELRDRLVARHKYGEAVRLIDLSIGGVYLETPRVVRPDADLVLEIIDAHTRGVSQVISRVLRANVAALSGGVLYRAGCVFKRPLSHPALMAAIAALPARAEAPEHLRLELALKTIVEGYFKRPRPGAAAGRWRDGASLLDALDRLRSVAERRGDPIDRQLAALLAATIPALQQGAPADAVLHVLREQLAHALPLVAIRTTSFGDALAPDRERVTLNMAVDADHPPMAVTAEFAAGFGLDASQFRLLKLSAYLVGLVQHWNRAQTAAESR